MSAFKKIDGRYVFVNMTSIHVPSWKIREVQKMAEKKTREMRKVGLWNKCVGRKRKYETAEDLKRACDKYFRDQECYIYDKWGQALRDPETGEYIKSTKPLTISGLGLSIGLATSTLRAYRQKGREKRLPPDFDKVLVEALQKIESYAENRGYDKDGAAGSKFILQAGFHWNTDKEVSETGRIKTETEIEIAKLKMQQEEHELKMRLLKSGLANGNIDSDLHITIKRAGED